MTRHRRFESIMTIDRKEKKEKKEEEKKRKKTFSLSPSPLFLSLISLSRLFLSPKISRSLRRLMMYLNNYNEKIFIVIANQLAGIDFDHAKFY